MARNRLSLQVLTKCGRFLFRLHTCLCFRCVKICVFGSVCHDTISSSSFLYIQDHHNDCLRRLAASPVSAMHLTLSTQPVRSQEKSLRWFTVQRQILFMPRFQEERVLWRSEQVPESLAQADDSDEDWMLTHHSLCHYVNMGKLKLRATSYFEPDFVSSHFESLHYCLTDTILDNRKEKTSGTLGCFKVSPYLLFSGFHFSFLSIFAFMR